jgi:hypothetical protein
MIIDLETRLERKTVHRADIRKERKKQGRVGGEVFGDSQKFVRRDDNTRFAFGLNHSGDGSGHRVPELPHGRIIIEFLRFHY